MKGAQGLGMFKRGRLNGGSDGQIVGWEGLLVVATKAPAKPAKPIFELNIAAPMLHI